MFPWKTSKEWFNEKRFWHFLLHASNKDLHSWKLCQLCSLYGSSCNTVLISVILNWYILYIKYIKKIGYLYFGKANDNQILFVNLFCQNNNKHYSSITALESVLNRKWLYRVWKLAAILNKKQSISRLIFMPANVQLIFHG